MKAGSYYNRFLFSDSKDVKAAFVDESLFGARIAKKTSVAKTGKVVMSAMKITFSLS